MGPGQPGHGFGCLLALGWELGEWYTFIRHGTELDTAYEDTLLDMTLGTLGSLVAGLSLVLRLGPAREPTSDRGVPRSHRDDPVNQ